MAQDTTNDGILARAFEVFYWLWAALALPLGVAVCGYVLHSAYPSTVVLVLSLVALVLSLYVGYRLAEYLRRSSRQRGGMAGAMATHATPELDDPPTENADDDRR